MGAEKVKLGIAIGCFAIGAAAVGGWFGVKTLGAGITLLLLYVYSLAFAFLFFYLRRRETGTWSYGVRRFEGEVSGHHVTLEFDERLMEMNRLRLLVDGDEVASDKILFGTKELHARTRDGTDLSVRVQSGWLGTCMGATVAVGGDEPQRLSLIAPPTVQGR